MVKAPIRDRSASKHETRHALVEAGLAEFAAHGLDVPSLDAICARAGFTRGAFYVHFRDRDEFLEAVMEKVFGAFLDAVLAGGGGANDLEETIARFTALLEAGGRRRSRTAVLPIEIHRVLDACARSPLLRRRFVALILGGVDRLAAAIERGQQAGSVRGDIDAPTLGRMLAMLALGILTSMETGLPIDFDATRDLVLCLLTARERV